MRGTRSEDEQRGRAGGSEHGDTDAGGEGQHAQRMAQRRRMRERRDAGAGEQGRDQSAGDETREQQGGAEHGPAGGREEESRGPGGGFKSPRRLATPALIERHCEVLDEIAAPTPTSDLKALNEELRAIEAEIMSREIVVTVTIEKCDSWMMPEDDVFVRLTAAGRLPATSEVKKLHEGGTYAFHLPLGTMVDASKGLRTTVFADVLNERLTDPNGHVVGEVAVPPPYADHKQTLSSHGVYNVSVRFD